MFQWVAWSACGDRVGLDRMHPEYDNWSERSVAEQRGFAGVGETGDNRDPELFC